MAQKIGITGELESKTTEGKLADTSQIMDATRDNASQTEINDGFDSAIQDNAADIQRLYRGTGIEEYSQFSGGNAYPVGTIVLYDGVPYKFIVAHVKNTPWDWNEVEPWSEKQRLDAAIADINANIDIANYADFLETENYVAGNVVVHNGKLRKFVADHAAGQWSDTDNEPYDIIRYTHDKLGVDIALKSAFTLNMFDKVFFNSGSLQVQETKNTVYRSITIQCYRGLTYTWNAEVQHIARFATAPRLGSNKSFIDVISAGEQKYTADDTCYVMFTIDTTKTDSITISGCIIDAIRTNTEATQAVLATVDNVLTEYMPIDTSIASKGFYNIGMQTKTFVASNRFDTVLLQVTAGTVYRYGAVVGGVSMAIITYFDNAGNVISYENRGSAEATLDIIEGTTVVPSGATEMSFTTVNSESGTYLQQRTYINVRQLAADNARFKADFLEDKSPNIWNGEIVDGVITTNGALQSIASWSINKSTAYIQVDGGHYYYLSGRNGDIRSIRCIDSAGNVMKVLAAKTGQIPNDNVAFYLPNITGTETVLNGQFKAPIDAKYVQISLAGDIGTWNTVMLEHVGEQYVENYVPAAYQPYSTEKIIAKSKIPHIPNKNADIALSRKWPLKVLLIGSSHGMNTISQFPWIAYKNGFDVTVGNVYKGSLTLQQIAASIVDNTSIGGWFKIFKHGIWTSQAATKFDDVISSEAWDYIILQRSASDDETWTADQSSAMDSILNRIATIATGVPTILFNTGFADPTSSNDSQQATSTTIINSAKLMRDEFQLDFIPVATAIQNARNTSLAAIGSYALHQLCYDSQHLDYGIGCYIAGATVFEFIFKKYGFSILNMKGYASYSEAKSFVGELVDTGGESNAYTEPTEETMMIAKYCAMAAVNDIDTFSTKLAEKYSIQ